MAIQLPWAVAVSVHKATFKQVFSIRGDKEFHIKVSKYNKLFTF